jgi:hypothetical protein
MWYEGKCVRLREELELLDIFDRVHENRTYESKGDDDAYSFRQKRRSQILAKISELQARKRRINGLRTGSAALLLSASVYATLHYLLR